MKKIVLVAGILGCAVGFGDVVFSNVRVRQLWPFSKNVAVTFTASGVEGVTQVRATAHDGAVDLGLVPLTAHRTDAVITTDGTYTFEFDPSVSPAIVARGIAKDFGVTLSTETVPDEDVLYRIYDLSKTPGTPGQFRCVTAQALTNGVWGSWEPTIWSKVTAVKTPVWTGVTNDWSYVTTNLVLRRIPAGEFLMGCADDADKKDIFDATRDITQRVVRITKPYYIGVFPVTVRQYRMVYGAINNTGNENRPDSGESYYALRGEADWPNVRAVSTGSHGSGAIIGALRAQIGVTTVDLPTEAQWEKAARAGAGGVYYDNSRQTHAAERSALAWNPNNISSGTGGARQPVGRLKPNNYGLYDTLGNLWEQVLDWQGGGTTEPDAVDPEGPTAAVEAFAGKRILKGGAYNTPWQRISLHARNEVAVSLGSEMTWRVCIPAE